MNGATQVFFIGVAYGHLLSSVAGGSGGDEPRHPWHPSSVHEADATPPSQRKQRQASRKSEPEEGPYLCPVCDRSFKTEKAVHGHMRSHPDRAWRGMEEPRPLDPMMATNEKQYRYVCEHCGAQFETRQALGGHRASHNGKMGCFWLSRQPSTVTTEPRHVLPFDLNDPVPEQQEE
ncbi:hypothetical protein PR202_gb28514 [Eleusine coracana subsp. coracana]|uniref:C2H2-type domain-containing protein n=1 Tax=Eleusine coracana subsp. coracana TaxID=191504 RepID=A0AAV5FY25_ELECO|nr:hypothetical protein QOZ80_6AG0551350 [Eleusine coracana subsp. coracana]GJN39400.1 hypothetical protein PR202_gb28514 [Eleusine coracana subsp. coracana]